MLQPVNSHLMIDAIAFNVDINMWPDNSINTVELAYRLDVNEFILNALSWHHSQRYPLRTFVLSETSSIWCFTGLISNILFHLYVVEADDEETFNEAIAELDGLNKKLEQLEFRRMFSGEYDSADCYLDLPTAT